MNLLRTRFGLVAAAMTVVVAVAAAALWWSFGPPSTSRHADPTIQRQLDVGESLYAQYCAACHGKNREGQPNWTVRRPDGRRPAPPQDGTGYTWHYADDQLVTIIRQGMVPPFVPQGYQSDMPVFEGRVSDEQIRAIIAFIKSRWPAEIRAKQRKIDEGYRRGLEAANPTRR